MCFVHLTLSIMYIKYYSNNQQKIYIISGVEYYDFEKQLLPVILNKLGGWSIGWVRVYIFANLLIC